MARAVLIAQKTIEEQRKQLDEQKPKVLFADAVATSKRSILIGELAKILKQNGVKTGQNRLFKQLREDGFLMKRNGNPNMPTQRSMELGLFEVKETSIAHSDGHVSLNFTTKVTPKGQQYLIQKYLGCTPLDLEAGAGWPVVKSNRLLTAGRFPRWRASLVSRRAVSTCGRAMTSGAAGIRPRRNA